MSSGSHARTPSSSPKQPRRRAGKSASGASERRSGRLRDPRRAIGFALGGAVGSAALVLLGIVFGFGSIDGPSRGGAVQIDWPAEVDSARAAAILSELGLVHSEGVMAMFLRLTGGTDEFVGGAHLLPERMDPWDLVRILERSPKRPTVRATIPEGFHRFDIAVRLEKLGVVPKARFLAATTDGQLLSELGVVKAGGAAAESAEGYLFPATYDLPVDSDPRDVVRRMVSESDRRFATSSKQYADGVSQLQTKLGFGRREIVILASIVEKEAAVSDEQPIIASVFLNRLLDPSFKPKRLQSDPTAMYACHAEPDLVPSCAGFAGKATAALNRDPRNRYSTYVNDGLPPGPVGNPGESAVNAVLSPAATKYLYFVAKGGGRHTFSETFDQHNEAVRKLRASSTTSEKPE